MNVLTATGTVRLQRRYFGSRATGGSCPVDALVGIHDQTVTAGACCILYTLGVIHDFKQAAEDLQTVAGIRVSPERLRQIVEAEGLQLAMDLVRLRGTIVLKSTCAAPGTLNLASLVVNEVRLWGSRCGPFPEAINALARQAVEVRSMISGTYPIEQAVEALEAAREPNNVKILLKMNAGPSR